MNLTSVGDANMWLSKSIVKYDDDFLYIDSINNISDNCDRIRGSFHFLNKELERKYLESNKLYISGWLECDKISVKGIKLGMLNMSRPSVSNCLYIFRIPYRQWRKGAGGNNIGASTVGIEPSRRIQAPTNRDFISDYKESFYKTLSKNYPTIKQALKISSSEKSNTFVGVSRDFAVQSAQGSSEAGNIVFRNEGAVGAVVAEPRKRVKIHLLKQFSIFKEMLQEEFPNADIQ